MIRRATACSLMLALVACATLPDSPASIDSQSQAENPAQYPAQAIRELHSGTAIVAVQIGADGMAHEVKVLQSSGYRELDRAAVAAAYTWRYKARIASGHPVPSYVRVPVIFHLNEPVRD